MPVLVKIQLPEGKSIETLHKVMAEVTELLSRELNEPASGIRVTVNPVVHNRYTIGGQLYSTIAE